MVPAMSTMSNLRTRSMFVIGLTIFLICITTWGLHNPLTYPVANETLDLPGVAPESSKPKPGSAPTDEKTLQPEHIIPDHPTYKPERIPDLPPIVDNFPLAAAAHSAADLPPIPPWNKPPNPHLPDKTPLFIGFTRNWRLLQQTVVSYITAGWPAEDIFVVENTGTMKSNELGLLSLQNPFFLNHTRLHMFGVNIITTPTLLTFAQMQNFFLWTAIEQNYTTYFWGHMDVVVLSLENRTSDYFSEGIGQPTGTYEGLNTVYTRAVRALRKATGKGPDPFSTDLKKPWAIRFFAYDRLALVNREAFESVGGWDTSIPYYQTDCDMHDRLKMYGYEYNEADVDAGMVIDVADSLDDLIVLYRKKGTLEASFTNEISEEEKAKGEAWKAEKEKWEKEQEEKEMKKHKEMEKELGPVARDLSTKWESDVPDSATFKNLIKVVETMERTKNERGGGGRNYWQSRQSGGEGEPYYRDPYGFQKAWWMIAEIGQAVYAEKWGHLECGLLDFGRKAGDEWRVEHDWE
jgi:hypothetical protein